jgi:hypothetical protein
MFVVCSRDDRASAGVKAGDEITHVPKDNRDPGASRDVWPTAVAEWDGRPEDTSQ